MFTESELKKHLSSGHFKTVYFVFGEEKMLVKRAVELIEKKLCGGEPNEFNYHVFTDETDIAGISVCADIVPFMSDRNVIKLVDFNVDKMLSDDFKSLMKLLEKLPDTTTVIIAMPTLEATSKTAKAQLKKLVAFVDKNGVCLELGHRTGLALERDLCRWAKAGGASMTELTAHKLIQFVGEDLNRLNTEMKKLTAYADGAEITPDMIDLLVHKTTEANIYDLFGFIMSGDTDRAMNALSVLFYEQTSGVSICSVLSGAYLDAYRVRTGSAAGKSNQQIAADFNYRGRAWALDRVKRQTGRVSATALRLGIDELVEVQTRLVTETVDERFEVERLICRLAMIAGETYDD